MDERIKNIISEILKKNVSTHNHEKNNNDERWLVVVDGNTILIGWLQRKQESDIEP